MKKTLIVLLIALFATGASAMAQKTVKLGHINSNELMQIMLAYSQYIEILEPSDLREFFGDIYQDAADRHCDYDDDDWLNDEEENFNDNADSIN